MAKTCDETSGGSIDGCANEHNSSSNSEPVKQPVLSYKAFRKFWETRMLRKQEDAQVGGADFFFASASVVSTCEH